MSRNAVRSSSYRKYLCSRALLRNTRSKHSNVGEKFAARRVRTNAGVRSSPPPKKRSRLESATLMVFLGLCCNQSRSKAEQSISTDARNTVEMGKSCASPSSLGLQRMSGRVSSVAPRRLTTYRDEYLPRAQRKASSNTSQRVRDNNGRRSLVRR